MSLGKKIGSTCAKLKGHETQKHMFFLYSVKSGSENEFEIRFVQFDLF